MQGGFLIKSQGCSPWETGFKNDNLRNRSFSKESVIKSNIPRLSISIHRAQNNWGGRNLLCQHRVQSNEPTRAATIQKIKSLNPGWYKSHKGKAAEHSEEADWFVSQPQLLFPRNPSWATLLLFCPSKHKPGSRWVNTPSPEFWGFSGSKEKSSAGWRSSWKRKKDPTSSTLFLTSSLAEFWISSL